MRFERDEAKSETNLKDRGFDFAFATLIFESATVEVEDRRKDYGECRVVAIGVADGLHLTVVPYRPRGPEWPSHTAHHLSTQEQST